MPPSLPSIGLPNLPSLLGRGPASPLMELRGQMRSDLFRDVARGNGPQPGRAGSLPGPGMGAGGGLPPTPGQLVAASVVPSNAPGPGMQSGAASFPGNSQAAPARGATIQPGPAPHANAAAAGVRPQPAAAPFAGTGQSPVTSASNTAAPALGGNAGTPGMGPLGQIVSSVATTAGQTASVVSTTVQSLLGRDAPATSQPSPPTRHYGDLPQRQATTPAGHVVGSAISHARTLVGQGPHVHAPLAQAPGGQGPASQVIAGRAGPGQSAPAPAPATGQPAPGQAVPGQAIPGQAAPGQAAAGQALPGRAGSGQIVPGQVASPQGHAGQVPSNPGMPGQMQSPAGVPHPALAARAELAIDLWSAFPSSPISGVHLWFDRPITSQPHAVLVGTLAQWLFQREATEASPQGHYYQVVISAAHPLRAMAHDEVVARVVGELATAFPPAATAKLLHSRVVTDPQLVFSIRPEVDAVRPRSRTALPCLHLAGDYVQTGWPATMEGAVVSGNIAAELILG